MIELVVALFAAALTAWVFRRKAKQRAGSAARGDMIGVPCMLKHPKLEVRWLRGRLVIGPTTMSWEPSTKAGAGVSLPEGPHQAIVRSPSLREAMKINGGSKIVELTSSKGVVLLAVMPVDVDHVLTALRRDEAR